MFWPVTMSKRSIAPGLLYNPAQVVSLRRSRKELFASGLVIARCTPSPVIHRPATSMVVAPENGGASETASRRLCCGTIFRGTWMGTYQTRRWLACVLVLSGLLITSAKAEESRIRNRTISYVMTDLFGRCIRRKRQAECPEGFNDGPREQFEKLFPTTNL